MTRLSGYRHNIDASFGLAGPCYNSEQHSV
jgi:hypothetical protein